MEAFKEVADALGSSGRSNSLAVWSTTAAEFVDEFQVLTEQEWQRLLRVGLRLAPGADVKELYCFRNVQAYDGVAVRVLRLVQESQPRSRHSEVWKIQKTPVVIREVGEQIASEWEESKNSSSDLTARETPPRPVNDVEFTTISTEEGQRKRNRSEYAGNMVGGSKCTDDEVRLPTKTRRLYGEKKERCATIIPLPGSHTNTDNSQRTTRQLHDLSDGFVAVIEDSSSSGSSYEDLGDESDIVSDASNRVHSDEESFAEDSARCSGRREGATFASAVNEDAENCTPYNRNEAVSQLTSATNALTPVWSVVENAATRAHESLNNICGLYEVVTAQDSLEYDLRWVEEGGDQQRWTMFGEPRTPGRISVNTRSQKRRTTRPKWKFW